MLQSIKTKLSDIEALVGDTTIALLVLATVVSTLILMNHKRRSKNLPPK